MMSEAPETLPRPPGESSTHFDSDNPSTKMASNQPNGTTKAFEPHIFDPDFTQNVINATGPKTHPRMRQVISSLIQHVHDFARENEITLEEFFAAVEMVSSAFHHDKVSCFPRLTLCPSWLDERSWAHV